MFLALKPETTKGFKETIRKKKILHHSRESIHTYNCKNPENKDNSVHVIASN